jgi:hypothetical protein
LRRFTTGATGPFDVTLGDAYAVLPFGNSVSTTTVTGTKLWEALENGVSAYPSNGRWPQIAGFKFTVDTTKAIGSRITAVQKVFAEIFNLEPDFKQDGTQFDHLFAEDEEIKVGALTGRALFVPGHTPACMAYQFGDAVFVGDTLFMPDVGSARCDFPGGDARMLYESSKKILSLPAETRLFMCHDYPPNDRSIRFETTVAAQRAHNIHLHDGVTQEQFVAMRTKRDATLEMPVLILPAVQINIRAGNFPPPEPNGKSYLKIPLNAL